MAESYSLERITAQLFDGLPEGRAIYLLIDAARSAEIVPVIEALSDTAQCLFDGEAREDLGHLAPWLVPLDRSSAVLEWFVETCLGKDRGIFLQAGPVARHVKSSLKRSLMVTDETGREMFFKFYRPSVLRSYFPELSADQRALMMRGMDAFWAESEDGLVRWQADLVAEGQRT